MVVPIAPTIAGIGAVVVVRILLWAKKQSFLWNMSVMILAILATAVTMEGEDTSTFMGFWIGIGYGAMGQGIINFGKTALTQTLKERSASAIDAFLGKKHTNNKE